MMIETARDLLKTPFKPLGRGGQGLDCLGLVLVVARAHGKLLNFKAPTSLWPSQSVIDDLLKTYAQGVAYDAFKAGDIAVFYERRTPRHLGILSGAETFIHASQTLGMIVEEALEPIWRHKLYGIFRLK